MNYSILQGLADVSPENKCHQQCDDDYENSGPKQYDGYENSRCHKGCAGKFGMNSNNKTAIVNSNLIALSKPNIATINPKLVNTPAMNYSMITTPVKNQGFAMSGLRDTVATDYSTYLIGGAALLIGIFIGKVILK